MNLAYWNYLDAILLVGVIPVTSMLLLSIWTDGLISPALLDFANEIKYCTSASEELAAKGITS